MTELQKLEKKELKKINEKLVIKKLKKLPNYYKVYLGLDILQLAEIGKIFYDYVADKDFEWDIDITDNMLYSIKRLINKIDI